MAELRIHALGVRESKETSRLPSGTLVRSWSETEALATLLFKLDPEQVCDALLLLVTALVLLVVLVLGLVADWMRRRDGDQRAKAIGTGEVIYEVAAAKRRETNRYDRMDTAELRAAKAKARAERERAAATVAQADAALVALAEWTPGAPTDRPARLRALNDRLTPFHTSVRMDPTTGALLSADMPRRRVAATKRKQARIAQDRTEALAEMPPIYEAVKPRFWGGYTGYKK